MRTQTREKACKGTAFFLIDQIFYQKTVKFLPFWSKIEPNPPKKWHNLGEILNFAEELIRDS